MTTIDNMLAPPPIYLPEDNIPTPITEAIVLQYPSSPLGWATLAEKAIATAQSEADKARAYAYARTGYHRSLDRLRANGWKGFGPVPYSHTPNQGVLRAIAALANASKMIGDNDEYDRCWQMLTDADPSCAKNLL